MNTKTKDEQSRLKFRNEKQQAGFIYLHLQKNSST